jgi:hypothetical protein
MTSKDGFHRIAVKPEVYEALVKLAQENGRTIGGQLGWMIKQTNIDHIDELPRPDAEAAHIPVVYVARGE